MITYFTPMFSFITKSIIYKKGILIPISILGSITLETIHTYLTDTSFLGVTTGFLILISILFIIDFWTGSCASHYEYKLAIKKVKEENCTLAEAEAEEKKFKSSKITFTFFKFVMLFMWIWLAFVISHKIKDVTYLNNLYNVIAKIPLILVALREYVSIGENIKRQYGKTPYIFTLAEKLFDFLQGKFLKKIDEETPHETNNKDGLDDY